MFRFASTIAEPRMVGLADLRLEPRDPRVRARCAQAESTLRAPAWVPIAEPSGSGRTLAHLVINARRADVTRSPCLDEPATQAATSHEHFAELLAALLPIYQTGSTPRPTSQGVLPGLS